MILVVGGTGQLGARVVKGLVERGESVRCLVRSETTDGDLRKLGAEVARGDLAEHATLQLACEGIATVVVTATAITQRLAGAKRPTIREIDEIGIIALVGACEKAGVQRFVYLSIAGLEDALDCPLVRAKRAVERRLTDSPMRTVIVRPDAFQDVHLAPLGRFDLRAGKVAVFGRGDCRHRWVSVEDVAQLVVAVALETHPPGMIEFGGPESLSRNETVALAERLTGRSFTKQRMPRAVARIGMRLLDRPNDALASIFGLGLHQDLVEADWDDAPLRSRGISPRSTTAWLEEQARA
jgi:uncharacterized protein YbjT (DUF2867 family)